MGKRPVDSVMYDWKGRTVRAVRQTSHPPPTTHTHRVTPTHSHMLTDGTGQLGNISYKSCALCSSDAVVIHPNFRLTQSTPLPLFNASVCSLSLILHIAFLCVCAHTRCGITEMKQHSFTKFYKSSVHKAPSLWNQTSTQIKDVLLQDKALKTSHGENWNIKWRIFITLN